MIFINLPHIFNIYVKASWRAFIHDSRSLMVLGHLRLALKNAVLYVSLSFCLRFQVDNAMYEFPLFA